MATTRTRKRRSSHRPAPALSKPRGVLHPRVQQVGPEHFGIVCFDCAKARSKFLLADFYGRILIPPTIVTHNQPVWQMMICSRGKGRELSPFPSLAVWKLYRVLPDDRAAEEN